MRLKEARGRCFSAEAGLLHPQCRGPYTVSRVRVSPRAAAQLAAPACGVPLADPVCGQSSLSVPVLQLKLRRPLAVPASLSRPRDFQKLLKIFRIKPGCGPRSHVPLTGTAAWADARPPEAGIPHTGPARATRIPKPPAGAVIEHRHRAESPHAKKNTVRGRPPAHGLARPHPTPTTGISRPHAALFLVFNLRRSF